MTRLNLNGTWHIKNEAGEELCSVSVPGSVISGMYRAGKIGHPYYRDNEYKIREMFNHDYTFTRTVEADAVLMNEKNITLVCEGLDTLAEIWINGEKLAKTNNMHRTYCFPINNKIHLGKNEICIKFKSVLKYIRNYPYTEHKTVNYVPCGAVKGNHLIRKAHSMFGWDWGPQLIDAGIWRDIYIKGNSSAQIEDVRIRQNHHDKNQVRINIAVTLSENTDKEVTAVLSDKDSENTIQAVCSKVSDTLYKTDIIVANPKLWWPNGYGDHPLYKLSISCGEESVEKYLGLRTLTISQEADEWGNEFAFIVNGVKIFARGGNYIPEDAVYPWIDREITDYILKSCVRANFNCVRVWGGGYYPSDTFYDRCDQYGLIVWQDLMYACNVYELTDEFADTAKQEVIDNVRRIRHHASLGLWCGNNEIESAWCHWADFQKESMYLRADYIKLFEYILPKALREADDVTFYWPSSPSSGGCFNDPDSHSRGDVHYWDVWHGQKPFSDYQNYFFRFCSEFGFQSFPSLKTIRSFTDESDRNIFSRIMESHQKNNAANGKMLYYLSENFRYPKDFKSLLYVTQLLQGLAIKSGVDHWRRNRGRCMGTLYWQINDNWPVASWSSIDYYGRWKALHYMAAKFYAPVAASLCKTGNEVCVYLENETFEDKKCRTVLRVRDVYFHVIKEWTAASQTDKMSSGAVLSARLDEKIMDKDNLYLEAQIMLDDGMVLTETETIVPYKYMALPKASITIQAEDLEEKYEITLKSDAYAPFIELDVDGADVIFSDNFFTLSNEKPVSVTIEKADISGEKFKDADDLKSRLTLTTVRDTF